jgi:hypothetical protein
MALIALDRSDSGQPPRRYFGGRDALAIAIGYAGEKVGTDAAHAAVKRALAQLIEAGDVQLYREGHGGFRSEYYVRLRSEEPASPEVLPALESTPAILQGNARRTPVAKEAHGLRTRKQRANDPQTSADSGTPGVPHGVRPEPPQGYAKRQSGVRPAADSGTPGVPPKRSDQEDQEQQHSNMTRAREELEELRRREAS